MEVESAEAVLAASDRAPRFHLDASHCSPFLVIFQLLCAELHVRGEDNFRKNYNCSFVDWCCLTASRLLTLEPEFMFYSSLSSVSALWTSRTRLSPAGAILWWLLAFLTLESHNCNTADNLFFQQDSIIHWNVMILPQVRPTNIYCIWGVTGNTSFLHLYCHWDKVQHIFFSYLYYNSFNP